MAKKEMNDDILAGGSLSQEKGKSKKEKSAKPKKSGKGISANTIKIIKSVIAVVVVVAILTAYVATGAVRKGFVHSTLQWTTGITAVTVKADDGTKIKVPVSSYNYYYAMTYNNLRQAQSQYKQYGLDLESVGLNVDFSKKLSTQTTTNDDGEVITWAEYIENSVVETIKTTYSYYYEAVKENNGEEPELTAEQIKEISDTLGEFKESAEKYGYTLSAYLVKALGKGVTEKVYRQEAKRTYIAQNFSESLGKNNEETPITDAMIDAYKDEHIDELQTVSIRVFEASTEDIAKEFKSKLNADGSNFTDLCAEYAEEDFYKSYYTDAGASTYLYTTKELLKNTGFAIATAAEHHHEEGEEHSEDEEQSYPGLDWLFSSDRKAGDSTQYSTSVVYVIAPAAIADVKTINIRHILINPEDSDSSSAKDASEEQWAEALTKAQGILDEFNNGDKTAESFAALATANSADTGSANNGGLYENVYPGQMVPTFNTWCFEGHKAGDTAIVKSEFGYHIMYFDSENSQTAWQFSAENALAAENSKTEAEKLADKYTAKLGWFGSRYVEIDVDIDAGNNY